MTPADELRNAARRVNERSRATGPVTDEGILAAMARVLDTRAPGTRNGHLKARVLVPTAEGVNREASFI